MNTSTISDGKVNTINGLNNRNDKMNTSTSSIDRNNRVNTSNVSDDKVNTRTNSNDKNDKMNASTTSIDRNDKMNTSTSSIDRIDRMNSSTSSVDRNDRMNTSTSSMDRNDRMNSSTSSSFVDVRGQEASAFLAAALEEMDCIIRTRFENNDGSFSSKSGTPENTLKQRGGHVYEARVIKLMDDLKLALELCEDKPKIVRKIPDEVLSFVMTWMVAGTDAVRQTNGYVHESAEEKARRLEADKNSLMLQVNILTEQIDAQGERVREMEYQLEGKRQKIQCTEEMYQNELLTRSSLETHKLDLMAEIASLKIRLATADNERRELQEKFRQSQRVITDLEARLALKDAEAADLRQKLARNGTVVSDVNEYEVERLKKAVDALMISNSEKDKRIEELRRLLRRYKKLEDILTQHQGRKVLDEILAGEDDSSSTSSTTPSVHETTKQGDPGMQGDDSKNSYSISPSATSTPVNSFSAENRNAAIASPPSTIASVKPTRRIQRSNSAEEITPSKNSKSPPSNKRPTDVVKRNGSYGTLPRDMVVRNRDDTREHRRSRGFPALGKALLRIRSTKRSCSAPNLAQSESMTDDEDGFQFEGSGSYHPEVKKKKGFLRFFGRLKRSGSQDFHEREQTGEFKRGGVRATAMARIGWSRDTKKEYDMSIPFVRWDKDRIIAWMNEIGLNMYLADCRRWVRNGEQLSKASSHDFEKELGIRHSLHRKKLVLAIQAMSSGNQNKAGELDHTWVMRWLDDIGLPQYKDNFFDARVDGRMLHALTVEDLLALKVSNELHHVSIKRGIQILRLNNWNTSCFKRRPSVEKGTLHNVAGDVVLWTNHRVMEWLRTIDLSEYAPNMRGSGVHGALMVLESRFNAELFAQLLSIPNNKTLLRRHLSTHFVSLVGNDIQIKKREQESSPGYVPLVPNTKIKKGKFGLFGHKRSKSETAEADGFICPLDLALPLDKLKNGALNYQEKEQDVKAAKEIGAFSKEITSLTHQLGKENFFDQVPTSNV